MDELSEIDEARRTSFDANAELYDTVRPSYPDALADDVMARAGRRVLEIGAGTGKATVVFARRGASIVAIEPGASMAAVLRRKVAGCDVTIHETTFEAWPLAGTFDVVMAAQSIHWVAPSVRYTKSVAALAPGGLLALLRSEKAAFDPSLRAELDAAYARFHPDSSDRPLEDPIAGARHYLLGELTASHLFGPVEILEYPWTQTVSTARYLDLLDTYSDHALLAPDRRRPLYDAIATALDRRGGQLDLHYVSMAFLARRA